MEEVNGLAASFQQQPPMTTQGQPSSSVSTAAYFGSNAFGEDDPFQFTNPPASTQYTNSHIVTDMSSQVGNYHIPSQQDPPAVTTKQEPVSMAAFSPVQDKQFFPTAAIPNTNILPPVSMSDQKTIPQDEDINCSLTANNDNTVSITSTASSDTSLTEQHYQASVSAAVDYEKLSGGEFFASLSSGKGQQTNVSGNPQLHHCSHSHPGSQPESSGHLSDVPTAPLSLPAFPMVQQQYATDVGNVGTVTGTFTNADLPLSSMLQSGPMPQPTLAQDSKELLPNSTLITNADIPGLGSMPSHSSSAANLSSLCSTPVDARTNADFSELDQQLPGAPPTTSICNSAGILTNADYKNVPSELKQFQPSSTTGILSQGVVMTTAVFQPSETSQVLQMNTEFDNKASEMMDPPSSVHFSVGSPSQLDAGRSTNATNAVPTQVTNVDSDVVSLQTTKNLEVVSTNTSTVSASHSMPLLLPATSKSQVEVKTLTAIVDSAQHGDTIEQQFLTSPVTQSPTSAFVEYSVTNNEKHDNPLHMSSGTQSVSSLLDCPDTSILSSPYKIVLPSPSTVEEKQSSFPPQSIRMPESVKVSSSEHTASVTTSVAVHVTATPKTNPAGSMLAVTQANMTSTPKQRDTQDTHPAVVSAPLVQQQEPQQRYTGSNEQHKRDFKDTSSLPSMARQQEHEGSYHHHQHRPHYVDHQSQYDYDYRHSRGSEVGYGSGHYIEDDRGYYPPSRPHSRMPYDYYHPHPHNDYYYYRSRSDYYRDPMDDPYYYEDSRYYHERDSYHGRDPYHGREQSRYYDRDQPRYRDARHHGTYDDYSGYSHGREVYDDRRMHDSDTYRYHQPPQHQAQKRYHGEESRYTENVDDRTDRSYLQQPHTQPLETTVAPPEASTIYGPRDHFEASQVYNEETLHVQSSYVDNENSRRYAEQYPEQYPERYPEQYPERYPEQYPDRYPEQYPDQYPGQYPKQYPAQYPEQQQQQFEDQTDTVYPSEETYYEQPPIEEVPVHPVERKFKACINKCIMLCPGSGISYI